jgi:multidrug efflux pump subunit AcrA (membrane-fusion protein)
VIGSPVQVEIKTRDDTTGIVVPDAAVVRGSNGVAQVWVKEAPESFRAVTVRTQPTEGRRTLLLAGVKAGDRVVTTGAELVNQVR